MKRSLKAVAGIAAVLGLGLAAVAFGQPGANGGPMGQGMGPGMMMHGHGMGPAMMHGGEGGPIGLQLMTPEEHGALQEKMSNAKTPEERQEIAEATRTEMQKRAQRSDHAAHARMHHE